MSKLNARILLIDDDPDVLTAAALLLKQHYAEVKTEQNPERLPEWLQKYPADVVILDMNFRSAVQTGNEGFYWLRQIKQRRPETAVILFTAYGDVEMAVRALKEGAADFVLKPWQNDKLLASVAAALNRKNDAPAPPKTNLSPELVGQSAAMQDVATLVEKVAATDANILIMGENGTGKDLLARLIHQKSLRALAPFVPVDMGALTHSLFESELFGYKKGAFTDAKDDRKGRFETAAGGTLFLDEIGNLSPERQAKLLTVLQNREVYPVGSSKAVPVNVRLVCATNAPLAEWTQKGLFRQDLFYRINTVTIHAPALRDRKGDIELLTDHFCQLYANRYVKPLPTFTPEARLLMETYAWPGNVRELQHCIERAVILCENNRITPSDLPLAPTPIVANNDQRTDNDALNLEELERNAIEKALKIHNGNISLAAKALGLTRAALYRRLEKFGLS